MDYFVTLVILLRFSFNMAQKCGNGSEFCRKGLYSTSSNMKYSYASFATFNHTGYAKPAIRSFGAKTVQECIEHCLNTSGCYTAVLKEKEFKCSVFSNLFIYQSKNLFHKMNAMTIGAKSRSCERQPCLNGGTCIPTFYDDKPSTYTCWCRSNSDGINCENYNGVKQYDFHLDIHNRTFGTSDLNIELSSGIVIGEPDQQELVLYCPGSSKCVTVTVDKTVTGLKCLHDAFEKEGEMCLLSLWIKFRGGEEARFADSKMKYSVIFDHYGSFMLAYDHGKKQWQFHRRIQTKYAKVFTFDGGDIYRWHHVVCRLSRNPTVYFDGKENYTVVEKFDRQLATGTLSMFDHNEIPNINVHPRVFISRLRLYPRFIDREKGFVRDLHNKENPDNFVW